VHQIESKFDRTTKEEAELMSSASKVATESGLGTFASETANLQSELDSHGAVPTALYRLFVDGAIPWFDAEHPNRRVAAAVSKALDEMDKDNGESIQPKVVTLSGVCASAQAKDEVQEHGDEVPYLAQQHSMERLRRLEGASASASRLPMAATRPSDAAPSIILPVAPLRSAYVLARGADPSATARTTTFVGALDHLFVSADVRIRTTLDIPVAARVAADADAVANGDWRRGVALPPIQLLRPLPDHVWASDHLAVGADIEF